METFLRTVTPNGEFFYLAWKHDKYFKHKAFTDVREAVSYIGWLLDKNHDVYFTPAGFAQGYTKNRKGWDVPYRKQENISFLKSFYFDVDCGPDKGYPDKPAAADGLQKFCSGVGLPAPTYVNDSGGGLHVYWVLSDPIRPDRWKPVADALKDRARELGFKADLAITGDSARVLRVPGTINQKRGMPVKTIFTGALVNIETLEALLPLKAAATGPSPLLTSGSADPAVRALNDDLKAGRVTRPPKMERIIEDCPMMGHIHANHGADCDYPLWLHSVYLASFCENGEKWATRLSDGHATFDQAQLDLKYQDALNQPPQTRKPTKCSTFANCRPSVCHGCKHWNKINSPIALGYREPKDPHGMPAGFTQDNDGIYITEWDKEGVPEDVKITDFTFHDGEYYEVQEGEDTIGNIMFRAHKNGTDFGVKRIDVSKFTDARATLNIFARRSMPIANTLGRNMALLMSSWAEKLSETSHADLHEKQGWIRKGNDLAGFVHAGTAYHANGTTDNRVRLVPNMTNKLEPHGDMESWRKGAQALMDTKLPQALTIMAASFGAPLMPFTGLPGCLLAIVSRTSGVGKTTTMNFATGVWGEPRFYTTQLNDTINSVLHKMSWLNNLPVFWDELQRRGEFDDITSMLFSMTGGREKSRLTSNIAMRETNSWDTLLITAGNHSLLDHMDGGNATDASRFRVFEIEYPSSFAVDAYSVDRAALLKAPTNYGHAGAIYARWLSANGDKVRDAVIATHKSIEKSLKTTHDERFWIGTMSVLLVGAKCAALAGIINIDIGVLHKYLSDSFLTLRDRMAEDMVAVSGKKMTAQDRQEDMCLTALSNFISANMGNRIVTDHIPKRIGTVNDVTILTPRHGPAFTIQIAAKDKVMRILKGALKDWFRKNGYEPTPLVKDLQRYHGARTVKVMLGGGTREALPQAYCIEIDLNRPAMIGLGGV